MEDSGFSYEILVIDDGSSDGSHEILLGIPDIRLITFAENHGTGTSRRVGTNAARGRIVVWTDADMTYPNDRIPDLVAQLENCDQVVGARTSEQGTAKLFRVPAKWTIRKLAEYLTRSRIPDLNSGLRAFRRDVGIQFTHLLPTGFSCVTTLTMAFLANGYCVRYMDIEYNKRAGKSKFHWRKDTRRYLTQVVRMMLSWEPLRVFLPIGMLLFVGASVKLGVDWATRDFRLASNTLLLYFAAFQVIVLGLLADLIVRQNRPRQMIPPRTR